MSQSQRLNETESQARDGGNAKGRVMHSNRETGGPASGPVNPYLASKGREAVFRLPATRRIDSLPLCVFSPVGLLYSYGVRC